MGKASRRKRERQGMNLTLPPGLRDTVKIQRHHAGPKISASLGDLIEPYVLDDMTLPEFRKLLAVGAIAWNLSTVDEPKRAEELARFTAAMDEIAATDFETIVRGLVARKRMQFPDDNRFIVTWDVTQN